MNLRLDQDIFQEISQNYFKKYGVALTKRQFQIIFCALDGKTSKETAQILGSISHRTVEDHWQAIYRQYQSAHQRTPLRSEIIRNTLDIFHGIGYKNFFDIEKVLMQSLRVEC